MFWIASSAPKLAQPVWHVGTIKELRGAKTGKVMSTYKVTLCTGRGLGGAWGCTTHEGNEPPSGTVCKACETKMEKTRCG